MRIAVGCDHRGLGLKQIVTKVITQAGHSYDDFGCHGSDPVDYPDIAQEVSEAVARGDFDYGVLICGTGIGMCIAANKVKGIRAALGHNVFSAHRARQHNDANVLCLAAEEGRALVPAIMEAFLTTEFEGERHQRRLDKIRIMEERR